MKKTNNSNVIRIKRENKLTNNVQLYLAFFISNLD